MSRIQLANHFKQQAFEVIGLNPQRMGQQIAQMTATGVEQATAASDRFLKEQLSIESDKDLLDAAAALSKDNGLKGQQDVSGSAILGLLGGHPNEATSVFKAALSTNTPAIKLNR